LFPGLLQDNLNVTAAVRDISSFKNESGMQIAEVKVESFQDFILSYSGAQAGKFFREYKIEFSRLINDFVEEFSRSLAWKRFAIMVSALLKIQSSKRYMECSTATRLQHQRFHLTLQRWNLMSFHSW